MCAQSLVYKTNIFIKLKKLMMLFYGGLVVFIFSGLWGFSSRRKHLLSALLRLEYLVIAFYFIFFIFLYSRNLFFSLIYLTFAACEGALGLSILVIISRTHGGDYFKSFNFF
jgi:NADH:ubiquinone oxidoreductase subunit K